MPSKIRDRILENAIHCFAAHGYSGCSTKSISVRADVTEGSLFRLFGSKEKLFTEALGRVRAENMLPQREFERLLDAGNLEEGIQGAFAAFYKKISPDAVRMVKFAVLERGGRAMDDLAPVYNERIKAVARRLRKGIATGEVRKDIDVTVAASAIYYAARNLAFDLLIPRRPKAEQLAVLSKFIDLWLHGVLH